MVFRFFTHRLMIVVAAIWQLHGCGSVQSMVSEDLARSLSAGIANQTDLELVKDGLPPYLLMLDGFITEDPENADLYMAGAKLYGAYASFIGADKLRGERLTDKAFDYSKQALCFTEQQWCGIEKQPFDVYQQFVRAVDKQDVGVLHTFAVSWVNYIDVHKSDWNAIADLPKVKATMLRIIELDEQYDGGSAHLYMAVLETLLPPALGGKPGVAKAHFEKVIELSSGQNLMAKVLYAERYARTVYNQELHDRLLKEVLAQDPVIKDLALSNVIAQQRARDLLKTADEYF